jgi:hypothetical protein
MVPTRDEPTTEAWATHRGRRHRAQIVPVGSCNPQPIDAVPAYPAVWYATAPDRAAGSAWTFLPGDGPWPPFDGPVRLICPYPLGQYVTRLDGTVFRVFAAWFGDDPQDEAEGRTTGFVTTVWEVVPRHAWRRHPPERLGDLFGDEQEVAALWYHHDAEYECRRWLAELLDDLPAVLDEVYRRHLDPVRRAGRARR